MTTPSDTTFAVAHRITSDRLMIVLKGPRGGHRFVRLDNRGARLLLASLQIEVPTSTEGYGDAWVNIRVATRLLKTARDLLKLAGAPKTLERVRLAITSAGGAARHANRMANEARERAG